MEKKLQKEDFSAIWKDGGNKDASGTKFDLKQHLARQRLIPEWVAAKESVVEMILSCRQGSDDKFKVLDIGCGHGVDLILVARKFVAEGVQAEVVGCDFNTEMVTAAQELVDEFNQEGNSAGVTIKVVRSDIFKLPEVFDGETFDVVRADITLQHLGANEKVLEACKSIHRVLKPRGSFISLEGSSSQFFADDAEVARLWETVMPSSKEGGPFVNLYLNLPKLGFEVVDIHPIPLVQTGASLATQDVDWVRLKGMGRLLVQKGVLQQDESDDFCRRYIDCASTGRMLIIGMACILHSRRLN